VCETSPEVEADEFTPPEQPAMSRQAPPASPAAAAAAALARRALVPEIEWAPVMEPAREMEPACQVDPARPAVSLRFARARDPLISPGTCKCAVMPIRCGSAPAGSRRIDHALASTGVPRGRRAVLVRR
jgi:hypothetical protein